MYIELTKRLQKVLVNTNLISYIEPHKDTPYRTVVHFTNGLYLVVEEEYGEVKKQCQYGRQRN